MIISLALISVFGVWLVVGIILVDDYFAAACYSIVTLLFTALTVTVSRFYVSFRPRSIELRQGYYLINDEDKARAKRETNLAPIRVTQINSSEIGSLSYSHKRGLIPTVDVTVKRKNGDELQISFIGYFKLKRIIKEIELFKSRNNK